jgi:hypothetical protein
MSDTYRGYIYRLKSTTGKKQNSARGGSILYSLPGRGTELALLNAAVYLPLPLPPAEVAAAATCCPPPDGASSRPLSNEDGPNPPPPAAAAALCCILLPPGEADLAEAALPEGIDPDPKLLLLSLGLVPLAMAEEDKGGTLGCVAAAAAADKGLLGGRHATRCRTRESIRKSYRKGVQGGFKRVQKSETRNQIDLRPSLHSCYMLSDTCRRETHIVLVKQLHPQLPPRADWQRRAAAPDASRGQRRTLRLPPAVPCILR